MSLVLKYPVVPPNMKIPLLISVCPLGAAYVPAFEKLLVFWFEFECMFRSNPSEPPPKIGP